MDVRITKVFEQQKTSGQGKKYDVITIEGYKRDFNTKEETEWSKDIFTNHPKAQAFLDLKAGDEVIIYNEQVGKYWNIKDVKVKDSPASGSNGGGAKTSGPVSSGGGGSYAPAKFREPDEITRLECVTKALEFYAHLHSVNKTKKLDVDDWLIYVKNVAENFYHFIKDDETAEQDMVTPVPVEGKADPSATDEDDPQPDLPS